MKAIKSIDDPRYVKAMSHPLRVRILAMLDERKASPNQLAGWLGRQPRHRRLPRAHAAPLGLIELAGRDARPRRGRAPLPREAAPGVTAEGWAQASPVARQAAVGSSLEVIGEYARVSAAAGGFERSDAQLRRALLRLDAKGFAQLSRACDKLLEQVEKIQADAARRLASSSATAMLDAGLGVLPLRGGASARRRRKCPGGGVGRRRDRHRGMRAGAACTVHGHRSEWLINGYTDSLSGNRAP